MHRRINNIFTVELINFSPKCKCVTPLFPVVYFFPSASRQVSTLLITCMYKIFTLYIASCSLKHYHINKEFTLTSQ